MNVNLIVGDEVTVTEPESNWWPLTYTGTILREWYNPETYRHMFTISVTASDDTSRVKPGTEITRQGYKLYPYITKWVPGLKLGTLERILEVRGKKRRFANLLYSRRRPY